MYKLRLTQIFSTIILTQINIYQYRYEYFPVLNTLKRQIKKDKEKNDKIRCKPTLIEIFLIFLLTCSTHARISVMYAHERASDMVAEQCLTEMYPRSKRLELQESDEPCIIYCVLKKFGIMNGSGQINLDIYRKRVRQAHQLDSRHNMKDDKGGACVESAEATQHKQDVCKKAKVFNDCTHLYRLIFK